MGREIRRVIPNWEHPRHKQEDVWDRPRLAGRFKSLYDRSFREAMAEWWEGYQAWERGERPGHFDASDYPNGIEFWEWESPPPDPAHYRPYWPEGAATWWQVYETVSEGTPITPPFATPEELVDWLSTNKDFWDHGPQPRARAEAFVKVGWVPSGVFSPAMGFLENFETLDAMPPSTEENA